MDNKIERDERTEGLKPYKFSLTKFSALIGETTASAYTNYQWVQKVIKHNPIFWFAPNAEDDDIAEDVTVKDDPEIEEKIDALIFIKAWCEPVEKGVADEAVEEKEGERVDNEEDEVEEENKNSCAARFLLDGKEIGTEELKKALDELVRVDDEDEVHSEQIILIDIKDGVLVFEKGCFQIYK